MADGEKRWQEIPTCKNALDIGSLLLIAPFQWFPKRCIVESGKKLATVQLLYTYVLRFLPQRCKLRLNVPHANSVASLLPKQSAWNIYLFLVNKQTQWKLDASDSYSVGPRISRITWQVTVPEFSAVLLASVAYVH